MKVRIHLIKIMLISLIISTIPQKSFSQSIQFGLYAEPLISWFSSDTEVTVNDGARPGFAFGLTLDRYFASNYAFSTGISIVNTSGRLNYSDTLLIRLKNSQTELYAGDNITYKLRYLAVPLGVKLKTNQIGYMTFFANAAMSPKVLISGKGDIPSQNIENESITEELKIFNLGYNITLGAEYSLGGSTSIAFGVAYEDNFLDVTKDNNGQPSDKISNRIIRFRIGLNF
ncbi:MAG TPA: hypothetical protein DEQ09_12185 [Bacteroidales bacterium]|nr:hypothetical protein [Bacteroidales bacterium]